MLNYREPGGLVLVNLLALREMTGNHKHSLHLNITHSFQPVARGPGGNGCGSER